MCEVTVLLKELDELFIEQESGAPRVSPKGAGLLLKLYRNGVLEVAERRQVEVGLKYSKRTRRVGPQSLAPASGLNRLVASHKERLRRPLRNMLQSSASSQHPTNTPI